MPSNEYIPKTRHHAVWPVYTSLVNSRLIWLNYSLDIKNNIAWYDDIVCEGMLTRGRTTFNGWTGDINADILGK